MPNRVEDLRALANRVDLARQSRPIPPIPGKHPLRNINVPLLSEILSGPAFREIGTGGMTPEEYGMHLSGERGKALMGLREALNDPQSELRQQQRVDLASRYGGKNIGTNIVMFPGPWGGPGYMNYGGYTPPGRPMAEGTLEGDLTRAISGLSEDVMILTPRAKSTRHELSHVGMSKLAEQGIFLTDDEQEIVAETFDYMLGDEEDKRSSDNRMKKQLTGKTVKETMKDPKFRAIIDMVQNAAFEALGGIPIPEPSRNLP